MKAWWVGTKDGGGVYARAETRGKARKFIDYYGSCDFIDIRVIRQPWLDGPGPAREIMTEWAPCPEDEYDRDGYSAVCFEGEKLDQARTLELLGGK